MLKYIMLRKQMVIQTELLHQTDIELRYVEFKKRLLNWTMWPIFKLDKIFKDAVVEIRIRFVNSH